MGFIILRYNDWAEPVRKEAVNICTGLFDDRSDDLFGILPYLEKVHRSDRRNEEDIRSLEDIFASKIYSNITVSGRPVINENDVYIRQCVYRLLLDYDRLNTNDIKYILEKERNGQCLRLIVMSLLTEETVSMDDVNRLLKNDNNFVKRKALEKKYELLGDYWEGLEEMLISSSKSIRDTVCFILRSKTNIDIRSYYMERLKKADDSIKAICILGIGENGVESDRDFIMQYLDEENSRIVKSVLYAIGKLQANKCDAIYWDYLQDSRVDVMCQAYREIKAYKISYGAKTVYSMFCQTDSLLLKKILVNILSRESCWDRIPYLLMLYWYEDEAIRNIVWRGLNHRTMYASISRQKAKWIEEILQNEQYNIPEMVKRDILFELKYVTQK